MSDAQQIVIKPARPQDAARAVEITLEAFNGLSIDQAIEAHCGPTAKLSWQEIKGRDLRKEFQSYPEHCFVAWLGEEMVGYVTNFIDFEAGRGRIVNLAVDRDQRGKGIGRLLLERSILHFRHLGLKQAKIETLASNEVGQHLYPSLGFEEVSRQVHFAMNL